MDLLVLLSTKFFIINTIYNLFRHGVSYTIGFEIGLACLRLNSSPTHSNSALDFQHKAKLSSSFTRIQRAQPI